MLLNPFFIACSVHEGRFRLLKSVLLNYIPFIVLLYGLFVVAGGIVVKGTLAGMPKINSLLIGTALASWIGTTGAAMLLIRPVIRANEWRKKIPKVHGAEMGINQPWQMFWAAGALSSFLDNTPTYLVFL